MDALYFNTNSKNALFEELGIPDDFQGNVYESQNNWALVWLGKVADTYETKKDAEGLEYRVVSKWKDGYFFNIYLQGQENMDFFTQRLSSGILLKEPETPNLILL